MEPTVSASTLPSTTLGGRLPVSVLGLGTLALCGSYGPVDEQRPLTTIGYALDSGVTLLDTADFYGGGAGERLIGKAVAGRRDTAVIATRGGVRSPAPGAPPTIVDGTPDSLTAACDAARPQPACPAHCPLHRCPGG